MREKLSCHNSRKLGYDLRTIPSLTTLNSDIIRLFVTGDELITVKGTTLNLEDIEALMRIYTLKELNKPIVYGNEWL